MISSNTPTPVKWITKHWKPIVGSVLVLGTVAVASTQAEFSSTAVISADISTGTLSINVDEQDGTITLDLDATGLKPGDTRRSTFVVKNDGTLPAVVGASTENDTALAGEMHARLLIDGNELYGGALDDLAFTGLALAAGDEATADLTLSVPSSLGNEFQGSQDALEITLIARQAQN